MGLKCLTMYFTLVLMLVGCVDFTVEKVVTLEGSADTACVTPAVPTSSASGGDAAPASVSEVVLPGSPVVSDAKLSPAPVTQRTPSLPSPEQLQPAEHPADTKETAHQPIAETEACDASLVDKMSSSSPSDDVTSQSRSTENESSSQPQGAMDDAVISAPVSKSS